MIKKPSAIDIDAILPQTQCGLCGYNGCMPYAQALSEDKAPINLCPPGGIKGLMALSELLGKETAPFLDEMQQKAKSSMRAIIREDECIGCTKCIKACPVDAILGSGKLMHTVITDECTGCELCLSPCPVDCIDMVEIDDMTERKNQYRNRYQARNHRLKNSDDSTPVTLNKLDYIKAALARAQGKK